MVAKIGGWICIKHVNLAPTQSTTAVTKMHVMMMLWLGSNAYTIIKSNINYCIQSSDRYMLINSLQKQTFFVSAKYLVTTDV